MGERECAPDSPVQSAILPVLLVLGMVALWVGSSTRMEPEVSKSFTSASSLISKGQIASADALIRSALSRTRYPSVAYPSAMDIYSTAAGVPSAISYDRQCGLLRRRLDLSEKGESSAKLSAAEKSGLWMALSDFCIRLGRQDDAIAAAEEACKLSPDGIDTRNALGYILADSDRNLNQSLVLIQGALRTYRSQPSLLQEDGATGMLVDSLGWVYYRQHRFADAARELGTAARLMPGNAEIRYHLGCALQSLKRTREARIEFQKCLACSDVNNVHSKASQCLSRNCH